MTVKYRPKGVCSYEMIVSAEDGVITDAKIIGGCNGNTQGVCRLIEGMNVSDAISRLRGIKCGNKETSCPDQLSIALQHLADSEKDDVIPQ